MLISLYGTDVLATLLTDNESLVSTLDSLVSVHFDGLMINPFYEMINEPTERAGGSLHNSRQKRQTFSIEAHPIEIDVFQSFLNEINTVLDKDYIYFACESYYSTLHASGNCIPIEMMGENYSNTVGYKTYSFEAKKKYI